ncbi:hypothetical protein [Clostridium mediterraneense]|nr:hypothetical protein [Clostridium mediterraneense]
MNKRSAASRIRKKLNRRVSIRRRVELMRLNKKKHEMEMLIENQEM